MFVTVQLTLKILGKRTTSQSNLEKAESNASNVPILHNGQNFFPLSSPYIYRDPHLIKYALGLQEFSAVFVQRSRMTDKLID